MKRCYAFFILAAWLISTPAMSQQDCTLMQARGIELAQQAQQHADAYDGFAKAFNAALQNADKVRAQGGDLDTAWKSLVNSRDQLRSAGQVTLSALSKLHGFNLQYAAAGCVPVTATTINWEYQQSIAPFQANMQKLDKIPDDWRSYPDAPQSNNTETCAQLASKVVAEDNKGRKFADKYDPLIANYDKVRQQVLLIPDHSTPVYTKLRNKLIAARDAALPGVKGYPAVLQSMYDLTMARNAAGCIHMSEDKLKEYRNNNNQLQAEIADKQKEMENLDTIFPAFQSRIEPSIPEMQSPLVSTEMAAREQTIRLRNNSSNILCLKTDVARAPECNLFPGQMRELHANTVRVFGGGYWTSDGQYADMSVCRDFSPAPNDREQIIHIGLEANCTAPVAAMK